LKLIKKTTIQKKFRPSLVGKAEPKRINYLEKPTIISDEVEHCIKYWNNHREVTNHTFNIAKPSKTIQNCKSLLLSFLRGDILNRAILPDDFDPKHLVDFDYKKFNLWYKQTVEDFEYFVDTFVWCINKNGRLPYKTSPRISLVNFLQGNPTLNRPAAILEYCFVNHEGQFASKNGVVYPIIKFTHPKDPVFNTRAFLQSNPSINPKTWFDEYYSAEELTNRAMSPKILKKYKDKYSATFPEYGRYEESEENENIVLDAMYACAFKNANGGPMRPNGLGGDWGMNGQIISGDDGHFQIFATLLNENSWGKKSMGIQFLKSTFFKRKIAEYKHYTKQNRPNAAPKTSNFQKQR